MSSSTLSPSDLWSSLSAARQNTSDLSAERDFLAALPLRLTVTGGIFAYGMVTGARWAKWGGGLGLGWQALEYFAARRRAELARTAAAAAAKPTRLGDAGTPATADGAGQGLAGPEEDEADEHADGRARDELAARRHGRRHHQPPEVLG